MPRNDGGRAWRSPGVLAQIDFSISISISAGLACLLRGSFLTLYLFNDGFDGIFLDKCCRGLV